jgi:hypothetical protein
MTPEQIGGAILAALAVFGGGTSWQVRRARGGVEPVTADPTSALLDRIGELETDLAAERKRTAELEAEVRRLAGERRELANRVSHLEGQVATLSALVTKLVERSA